MNLGTSKPASVYQNARKVKSHTHNTVTCIKEKVYVLIAHEYYLHFSYY